MYILFTLIVMNLLKWNHPSIYRNISKILMVDNRLRKHLSYFYTHGCQLFFTIYDFYRFSDISSNTIQAIPIPRYKNEVEAFLDDIFDRALDNGNNSSAPKQLFADKTPIHKFIKGGRPTERINNSNKVQNQYDKENDVGKW